MFRPKLTKEENRKLQHRLWDRCLLAYCKDEWRSEINKLAKKYNSCPSKAKTNATFKVVKSKITNILHEDFSRLQRLVEEFLEPITDELAEEDSNITFAPPYNRKKKYQKVRQVKITRDKVNQQRKRIPWTEEETNLLVKLVKGSTLTWIELQKHFNTRTNVDLKDKWRNLVKVYGSEKLVFQAYGGGNGDSEGSDNSSSEYSDYSDDSEYGGDSMSDEY
jgi:hypothetical protein